ncbi:BgTH12-07006 [Blumeria graminis f. sp. triticale]|uniref:BgTH12-07006 n=1 Tax=Blumeria graminis f. sp. triticale TaxID=1689686 RepID=A0A9W4GJN0_BLUGR|nr:BgTH12-07006 [Blumeria graminis f. sp. triticale]
MASNDSESISKINRISVTTTAMESSAPTDDLSAVVDELLNSLSNKFAGVSSEIFAKMDDISRRLDNLEANLKIQASGKDNVSK